VAAAKAEGVRVTAEVMPHHLLLSDEWVAGDRTLLNVDEPPGPPAMAAHPDTKVNPPLRPVADTVRLLDALKTGVFDIVATDHAPHSAMEKVETDFEHAAMGMSGLEFALPCCLALVRAGHLTLPRLIELLATEPGRLLGVGTGTLKPGAPGDLVVFDPEQTWTVSPSELKTKSHNTPLMGMQLRGRAVATIVAGEVRFGG
jgi:dihydroorotase